MFLQFGQNPNLHFILLSSKLLFVRIMWEIKLKLCKKSYKVNWSLVTTKKSLFQKSDMYEREKFQINLNHDYLSSSLSSANTAHKTKIFFDVAMKTKKKY